MTTNERSRNGGDRAASKDATNSSPIIELFLQAYKLRAQACRLQSFANEAIDRAIKTPNVADGRSNESLRQLPTGMVHAAMPHPLGRPLPCPFARGDYNGICGGFGCSHWRRIDNPLNGRCSLLSEEGNHDYK